jgi:hypothetical protein
VKVGKGQKGIEMKRLFSAVFFIVIIVSPVYAQSTLALQEKCAEGAKKFFFERLQSYGGSWGSFSDFGSEKGSGFNHFTSHYNKKLDKCFIRIEFHFLAEGKTKKAINTIDVWDVFEGKLLAGCSLPILHPMDCKVGNKECNSLSEFENLVRPYMEE